MTNGQQSLIRLEFWQAHVMSHALYNVIALNLDDVSRIFGLLSKLRALTKSFPKMYLARALVCQFSSSHCDHPLISPNALDLSNFRKSHQI